MRKKLWVLLTLIVCGCSSEEDSNDEYLEIPDPIYEVIDVDFDVDALTMPSRIKHFQAEWDGVPATEYRVCRYDVTAPNRCAQQGNTVADVGMSTYLENFHMTDASLLGSETLCFYLEISTGSGKQQSEYECLDTEDKMEAMRVFSALPTADHKENGGVMTLLSPDGQYFAFTTKNSIDYTGTLYIYAKQADTTWQQVFSEVYYYGSKIASFGFGSVFNANSDHLFFQLTYSKTNDLSSTAPALVIFKNTAGTWAKVQEIATSYRNVTVSDDASTFMICNDDFQIGAYQIYDDNGASSWTVTVDQTISGAPYATRRCFLNSTGDHAVIMARPTTTHTQIYTLKKESGTWNTRQLAYENNNAVGAAFFGEKALITSDHQSLFNFYDQHIEHYSFNTGTSFFSKEANVGQQTATGAYMQPLIINSTDTDLYASYGGYSYPKSLVHLHKQSGTWQTKRNVDLKQQPQTNAMARKISCDSECHNIIMSDYEVMRVTTDPSGFDLPSRAATSSEMKGLLHFY
jgi:hypothetical protein